MNPQDFNKLAKNRFAKCTELMGLKSNEYARDNDKLHNFKMAGLMQNVIPEQALMGMKVKHDVSIYDIVEDIYYGKLPSLDLLAEKISDEINYLVLLEALITERINKNNINITSGV